MKILTAVAKEIKKYQEEYLKALEDVSGGGGTVITDVADGDTKLAREMIIGTGRYDITVYSTGGVDRKYDRDEEHESENWTWGASMEWYCEKKIRLAEDADAGLFLWDGWEMGIYTDILSLIMRGKHSAVIYSNTGERIDVNGIDDLRRIVRGPKKKRYICMNEFLEEKDYEDVIDTFVPSKEMAGYLKEHPVPKHRVIDIIINAPVRIEKKAIFLKSLSHTDNVRLELADTVEEMVKKGDLEGYVSAYQLYKTIEMNTFAYHLDETDKALRELDMMKPSDVLCVCCAEFSGDDSKVIYDVKRSKEVPVRSREKVGRYIGMDEYYVERWAFGFDTYWYEAVKWGEDDRGDMEKRYSYVFRLDHQRDTEEYVSEGEGREPSTVMFFDKCIYKSDFVVDEEANEKKEPVVYVRGRRMLPLPVPFEPGDVLKLDCLPFLPVTWVVLLEVNNDDPCGAMILYRDECGLWQAGVLDRDFGYGIYRPRLSCFYRIEKYQGPMTIDELPDRKSWFSSKYPDKGEILRKVSGYICHDKEKGSRLVRELFAVKKGGLTDDELLELIYEEVEYERDTDEI